MNFYEHVFIVRPEISAQRVESLAEEFSSILTEKGGKLGKTEYWGLKELAYPIKKNAKGHYILMNLTAAPEDIGEMERQMKLHDDVLRYLTLRVDEHETSPSIQMKQKDRNEEENNSERPQTAEKNDA
jgi:small subunit ribosomal protein S6